MINRRLTEATFFEVFYAQRKIELSAKLSHQQKPKCPLCLSYASDMKITSDSGSEIFLCDDCVHEIKKHSESELKVNPTNFCDVCMSEDGKYFINGITTSLCSDCFREIKSH